MNKKEKNRTGWLAIGALVVIAVAIVWVGYDTFIYTEDTIAAATNETTKKNAIADADKRMDFYNFSTNAILAILALVASVYAYFTYESQEKANKLQNRAWVGVVPSDTITDGLAYSFSIKNSGSTPATNINVNAKYFRQSDAGVVGDENTRTYNHDILMAGEEVYVAGYVAGTMNRIHHLHVTYNIQSDNKIQVSEYFYEVRSFEYDGRIVTNCIQIPRACALESIKIGQE